LQVHATIAGPEDERRRKIGDWLAVRALHIANKGYAGCQAKVERASFFIEFLCHCPAGFWHADQQTGGGVHSAVIPRIPFRFETAGGVRWGRSEERRVGKGCGYRWGG